MAKNKVKVFLIFGLVLFFAFILADKSLAGCCPHGDCCCSGGCAGVWGVSCEIGCCCVSACQPWQICSGGSCCCQGSCIEAPYGPRYYSNRERPFNLCSPEAEEQMEADEIYLPVKLDWEDVLGWIGGPRGCDKCNDCDAGCVQSYVIEIKGKMNNCEAMEKIAKEKKLIEKATTAEEIEKSRKKIRQIRDNELIIWEYSEIRDISKGSEWIPPCSCFFNTTHTYQWRVKACCDPQGTNCGPWSPWWEFKTTFAPEPKEPYDPDWTGPKVAENVDPLVEVSWCGQEMRGDYNTEQECEAAGYHWHEKYESCYEYSHRFLSDLIDRKTNTKECHPKLVNEQGKCVSKHLSPPDPYRNVYYHQNKVWNDHYRFFTKEYTYSWQVAACKDAGGTKCPRFCQSEEGCPNWEFSQKWRLKLKDFKLKPPQLTYPYNDPQGKVPVGLPVTFTWLGFLGSNSYIFQSPQLGTKKVLSESLTFDYPTLKLDRFYQWKIQPCWGYKLEELPEKCERDVWSETFTFKTTGQPPKKETMSPQGENVPIPATFRWEEVPGARSYFVTLVGAREELGQLRVGKIFSRVVESPQLTLDYPFLVQEENYTWTVASCAREKGEVCGLPEMAEFKTFKLQPPEPLHPIGGIALISGKKMTHYLEWKEAPFAKFYQYKVEYLRRAPEERDESCQPGIIVPETLVASSKKQYLNLKCLGQYQWQVRSCLDPAGSCSISLDLSEWSSPQTFSLEVPTGPIGFSLVPCGQKQDNPATPWKETNRCEIKHLFILLRNIITFIFERLVPLSLVLLLLATGVVFYLSRGLPETAINIKELWKAAGKGYLLIFFAWLIINLILAILGYQFGIFGHWFQIKF